MTATTNESRLLVGLCLVLQGFFMVHEAALVSSVLAQSFLSEIFAAEERQFSSVVHGTDIRYRSRPSPSTINPQPSAISGSALVHEYEVVHAAFFRLDETEPPDRMASYRHCRHRYSQ
jgi:hypothetical protein